MLYLDTYATDLLREVSDNRFLIENMLKVGLDDEAMIGYSPAQSLWDLSRGCFMLVMGGWVRKGMITVETPRVISGELGEDMKYFNILKNIVYEAGF